MNPILSFFGNTLAAGAGAAFGADATLRATSNLRPFPFPHQLASVLDGSLRRQYLDPAEVLGMYGVAGGLTVLDLGCGTGIFTIEAARLVDTRGLVHAVDLQAAMIRHTADRVAGAGVHEQVKLHHCGAYSLPFPDDSIDVALLIATLGEIPDKPAALNELRRVLRSGARVGVTEEILFPTRMRAATVRRWLEEAGFQFGAQAGSPVCRHAIFYNQK